MTIPGGYRPPPVPGWIPPVPPPPRFAAAAAAAAATAMSDKLAAAAADEMPTKKCVAYINTIPFKRGGKKDALQLVHFINGFSGSALLRVCMPLPPVCAS